MKDVVFRLLEKIIPDRIFDFIWSKYYIWSIKRNRTEVSEGIYYVRNKNGVKSPNYCIFRFGPMRGLFSVANQMLFYYEWAVANNYIPIADVEFEEDFRQEKFGLNNVWEYCFKQPESLKEVFRKGNVLVSAINGGNVLRGTCKAINGDPQDWSTHAQMQDYREYYARLNQLSQKVWKFKPEVRERIENTLKELFQPGMRVMGVILREEFGIDDKEMTAEQRALYKKHPKALSLEESYSLIAEYMSKWNCTHVLITTEFQESIEYFKDKLGSRVIIVERERRSFDRFKQNSAQILGEIASDSGKSYKEALNEKESHIMREREEFTISYVLEMAAVANCNYCMGVKCSGLIAACILNGGTFEDLYIFEDRNNIQNY